MAVALFNNRQNAEAGGRLLAAEGFKPRVQGESWLQSLWFVPRRSAGVWLEVAADEFERAEQRLLVLDGNPPALRQAIRCPECGSLRVEYPQFAEHSLLTNLTLGIAAEVGLVEKEYYCEQCHFTWPKEGHKPRRDRPHLAPYYFIEGIEQTTQPEAAAPDQHREAA